MTAKSSHYHVMKEGVSVEVTSIGFAIPLPSDGYVYDFMFDFGEIRYVAGRPPTTPLLAR